MKTTHEIARELLAMPSIQLEETLPLGYHLNHYQFYTVMVKRSDSLEIIAPVDMEQKRSQIL